MKDQEGLLFPEKRETFYIFVKVKNIPVSFDLKSPTLHHMLPARSEAFEVWTLDYNSLGPNILP